MSDAQYAYHEAGHAVAAAVLGFPFRNPFACHSYENNRGVYQLFPFWLAQRLADGFTPSASEGNLHLALRQTLSPSTRLSASRRYARLCPASIVRPSATPAPATRTSSPVRLPMALPWSRTFLRGERAQSRNKAAAEKGLCQYKERSAHGSQTNRLED
jgi:hypothetical protein